MKIGLIGVTVTLLGVTLVGHASAEKLGDSGTTAIGGQVGISMQSVDIPPSEPVRAMGLHTAVMVDRFVAPRVSVGVSVSGSALSLTTNESGAERTTRRKSAFGALSVGYFIPLGERAGLWPIARVGAGASLTRNDSGNVGAPGDARVLSLGADLQLTYALSDHVYLRAVPGGVRAEIAKFDQGSARSVSAGFNGVCFFGVGGWF